MSFIYAFVSENYILSYVMEIAMLTILCSMPYHTYKWAGLKFGRETVF